MSFYFVLMTRDQKREFQPHYLIFYYNIIEWHVSIRIISYVLIIIKYFVVPNESKNSSNIMFKNHPPFIRSEN